MSSRRPRVKTCLQTSEPTLSRKPDAVRPRRLRSSACLSARCPYGPPSRKCHSGTSNATGVRNICRSGRTTRSLSSQPMRPTPRSVRDLSWQRVPSRKDVDHDRSLTSFTTRLQRSEPPSRQAAEPPSRCRADLASETQGKEQATTIPATPPPTPPTSRHRGACRAKARTNAARRTVGISTTVEIAAKSWALRRRAACRERHLAKGEAWSGRNVLPP